MGDRANVAVLNDSGDAYVYLYTHWAGKETPHDVQKALKLLDEGSELAGTIFVNMFSPSCVQMGRISANDHAVIVVDAKTQRIGFAHEDEYPVPYKEWTFSEYVELSPEEIAKHYSRGRTIDGQIGREFYRLVTKARRAAKVGTELPKMAPDAAEKIVRKFVDGGSWPESQSLEERVQAVLEKRKNRRQRVAVSQ